jgi:hypothetical protein
MTEIRSRPANFLPRGPKGSESLGKASDAEASALPRALYSAAAKFGVGSNGSPG